MLYHASPRAIIPISKSLGYLSKGANNYNNPQIKLATNIQHNKAALSAQYYLKSNKCKVINSQGIKTKEKLSLKQQEQKTKYLEEGELIVRQNPQILNIQNIELLNTSTENCIQQQPSFLYSSNTKNQICDYSQKTKVSRSMSIHLLSNKNSLRQSIQSGKIRDRLPLQGKTLYQQKKKNSFSRNTFLQSKQSNQTSSHSTRVSNSFDIIQKSKKVNINRLQSTKLKLNNQSKYKNSELAKLENSLIKQSETKDHDHKMQQFVSAQFERKLQQNQQFLLLTKMRFSENWNDLQTIESQILHKTNIIAPKKGLTLAKKIVINKNVFSKPQK